MDMSTIEKAFELVGVTAALNDRPAIRSGVVERLMGDDLGDLGFDAEVEGEEVFVARLIPGAVWDEAVSQVVETDYLSGLVVAMPDDLGTCQSGEGYRASEEQIRQTERDAWHALGDALETWLKLNGA